VGGEQPCIADFAMAPLIYVLGHPAIRNTSGFEVPEVWNKWLSAMIQASPAAYGMLCKEGVGSLKELLDKKAPSTVAPAAPANENETAWWSTGHPEGLLKGRPSDQSVTFGYLGSPNTMGPYLFAKHIFGEEHQFLQIDLGSQGTLQPAFQAVAPFGQVPVFQDKDGSVLSESNAILTYLALKYQPKFMGRRGSPLMAWALQMRHDKILNGGFCDLVYPVLGFRKHLKPDELVAKRFELQTNLDTFEKVFLQEEQGFICGHNLCVADFAVAPLLFCLVNPAVVKRTGFALSDRLCSYLQEFVNAVPCSSLLHSTPGSIGDILRKSLPSPANPSRLCGAQCC